ncbi:MAG: MBOAT family protein [Anaerolineales bacterium]|nr:MBOAT family protein [Anaerolineales bacterium]
MGITTTWFFLGVVLFAAIFWLLPRTYRILWLLLGSLAFLASWSWTFLLILAGIGLANYLIGRKLAAGRKPVLLWAGILLNVAALVILKYFDFFIPVLTSGLDRLGIQTGAGGLELLVPVGLSFLAVQFISYLVDVHASRIEAEKDLLKFSVYVFYFPKLLSGPIERAGTFLRRLETPPKPTGEMLSRSLGLILFGLVRKVILADGLTAMLPSDLAAAIATSATPLLLAWLLAFALALYNDFAGYTSIVRGVSGLLGIELSPNFRVPYFSRNFNEFWTRWHISLSNWLRDYIFFPLSRSLLRRFPNRRAVVHLLLPPLATMLVSGLWHGLSWNMLVWGGLHGLYLVTERLLTLRGGRRSPDQLPRGRQAFAALVVFACVAAAWVPFRFDLGTVGQFLQALIDPAQWQLADYRVYLARFLASGRYDLRTWMPWIYPLLQLAIFTAPALLLDAVQYKDELAFLKWPRWIQALALALAGLAFWLTALTDTAAPFVYQGF